MTALLADDIPVDTSLFTRIADDIYSQGYSVQEYALPEALANALFLQNNAMSEAEFQEIINYRPPSQFQQILNDPSAIDISTLTPNSS